MIFKIIAIFFLLLQICSAATSLVFTGKGFTTQGKVWSLLGTDYTRTTPIDTSVTNMAGVSYFFRGEDVDLLRLPWWNIHLAAPAGQILGIGTYSNTVYNGFAVDGSPSFILSGDGRVDPRMSGTFTVLEIEWAPVGSYATKIAVDFSVSDSTGENTAFGSLRYNSDIPVSPVPEPSTSILGLLSLALVVRRKR